MDGTWKIGKDQPVYELYISRTGELRCREVNEQAGARGCPVSVGSAFEKATRGAGLFALGALKKTDDLGSIATFWRDIAMTYMGELCHTPENAEEIDPIPFPVEAGTRWLLSCPPMKGAEYVSQATFSSVWTAMDDWVRGETAQRGGLAPFLSHHAPSWRQVGRVCFHLAENKDDPDFPFAFMSTYSSGFTKSGRLKYIPLSAALKEYAGARNRRALLGLLRPVHEAAKHSAFVKELIDSGDIYHPFSLSAEDAYKVLTETPIYEESGLKMQLPNWWKRRPRPEVSVSIGQRTAMGFGAEALLDFNIGVAVGDLLLTPKELRALLAGEDGLRFVKGQWVEIDKKMLEEVLAHWEKVAAQAGDGVSLVEGLRLLAGTDADLQALDASIREWSRIQPGAWLEQTLARLREPGALSGANPGKTLKAKLRPYQTEGVRWLWFLKELGLGACLADDMGLGKTIQVISLLLILKKKKAGPSLLVVPASLMANWRDEVSRFAPSLKIGLLHRAHMTPEEMAAFSDETKDKAAEYDAVITSYAMAGRIEGLFRRKWELLVLDEAQAIKNPATRQTKTIKKIDAACRVALTGTPVENRLSDLWSIFDALNPGLLGTERCFKSFVKTLESDGGMGYGPLRNLVSPYLLRRLKTDRRIIKDLPDKTEMTTYCNLAKPQAVLYQKHVEELGRALLESEGIQRRGIVLSYLMRFKQICNHPSQLKGDSFFAPQASGKMVRLRELAEEIGSRQEKLLVFTQFKEMTGPLSELLADCFGRGGLVLHGGTPVKVRQKLVDAFQDEAGPPFFVLSLKAGGTGLNLTAANHVIHFDRWWNPAVENQATDRAFRIGQKKNVLVHKFVCKGTLEEKIDRLINEKAKLAGEILEDSGIAKVTEMSDEQLMNLVSLDLDAVGGDE